MGTYIFTINLNNQNQSGKLPFDRYLLTGYGNSNTAYLPNKKEVENIIRNGGTITLSGEDAFYFKEQYATGENSLFSFILVNQEIPTANFTVNNSNPNVNQTIQFTDTSQGKIYSWFWDFGDLSPSVNIKNPTHAYSQEGTYTVRLRVTNSAGTSEHSMYINVGVSLYSGRSLGCPLFLSWKRGVSL